MPAWGEQTIAVYLVTINLITAGFYFMDKRAAVNGNTALRTPETTLHLLGILGGWPGALIARHAFRHKTRKQPFVFVFWLVAAINVAATLAIGSSLIN